MRNYLFLILSPLLLAGCASVVPSDAYVAADRQTKTAVEPLLQQVKKDRPELTADIDDVLKSWEMRLSEAEKAKKPE